MVSTTVDLLVYVCIVLRDVMFFWLGDGVRSENTASPYVSKLLTGSSTASTEQPDTGNYCILCKV